MLLPPLLQTHRTAVLMRTTGYFAGQSTAVVEILQSSAPGLVMVMMMVGNAAAAVGAGDGSVLLLVPFRLFSCCHQPTRPVSKLLFWSVSN